METFRSTINKQQTVITCHNGSNYYENNTIVLKASCIFLPAKGSCLRPVLPFRKGFRSGGFIGRAMLGFVAIINIPWNHG